MKEDSDVGYRRGLSGGKGLERKMGFEPTTLSLARRCSTAEPLPLIRPWARCRGTDSNCRHRHFQCRALPPELPRPVLSILAGHLNLSRRLRLVSRRCGLFARAFQLSAATRRLQLALSVVERQTGSALPLGVEGWVPLGHDLCAFLRPRRTLLGTPFCFAKRLTGTWDSREARSPEATFPPSFPRCANCVS